MVCFILCEYLFVCLFICVFICLFYLFNLFICLFIYLFTYLFLSNDYSYSIVFLLVCTRDISMWLCAGTSSVALVYTCSYLIQLFDLQVNWVSCEARHVVFVSQRQCITTKLISSGCVSSSQLKQKTPKSLVQVTTLVKTTYLPTAVATWFAFHLKHVY